MPVQELDLDDIPFAERDNDDLQSLLNDFKKDLNTDADVTIIQREQASEDMRYVYIVGGSWEGFFDDETSDRVRLEFPLITNFVTRLLGEWNKNRMGVDFKPGDNPETTDKDAKLMNGIFRRDFNSFGRGKKALDNAVLEAITCGFGALKLAEAFVDKADPENELLDIEIRSIFNAYNTVIWDNASQEMDKSDARHVNVLTRYTLDSFKEKFPNEIPSSAYDPENYHRGNSGSNRFNEAEPGIYIATRYNIKKIKEKVFVYFNSVKEEKEFYSEKEHEEIKSELRKAPHLKFIRERVIEKQGIEKSIFSGDAIFMEPKLITGMRIPIVPVYAHRGYVDGEEWYRGVVRPLKDSGRVFNSLMSQLMETASSSNSDIPIFTPEQMENEVASAQWANPSAQSYLLLDNVTDDDGKIVQTGPVGYLKARQIDPSSGMLLQLIPQILDKLMGGAPQETFDANTSGKAIAAIKKVQDLATQPIMENFATAIQWMGVIYFSKAVETYTTNRMMRIIGEDGTETSVELMKNVFDPKSGEVIQTNNIKDQDFRVYSDVGPQYETLREQEVEEDKAMLAAMQNIPGSEQFAMVTLSNMFINSTGPGSEAKRKIGRRNLILMGVMEPETDEEIQMFQQAQQQQQPNSQEEFLKASAKQAEGEAIKFVSEAKNLDSKSFDNLASAELKKTQAVKNIVELSLDKAKTASDIRVNESKIAKERADIDKEILQQIEALPI